MVLAGWRRSVLQAKGPPRLLTALLAASCPSRHGSSFSGFTSSLSGVKASAQVTRGPLELEGAALS